MIFDALGENECAFQDDGPLDKRFPSRFELELFIPQERAWVF